MVLTLSPKTVLRLLIAVVSFLVCANLIGLVSYFVFDSSRLGMFDLDQEGNVTTFYASASLLFSGVLLGVIATAKKKQQSREFAYWLFLSAIFVFLSIDESASLHERLIRPVRELFSTTGIFYYAWVIPYGGLVILMGGIYMRFVLSLPRKTGLLFILAGAVFLTGAIGGEFIGGFWYESYGVDNIAYAIITMFEESFEMIGIVIFIYGLLQYLKTELGEVSLTIGS